jgi:hypothetical protein
MYTSLANFLKIWSNCGYSKSPKKTLVLRTFFFNFAFWLYIYIATAKKKRHWEPCREQPTHPPTPSLARVPPAPRGTLAPPAPFAGNGPTHAGPTRAVAGNGPDDGHGSRGEQFVSCSPRLACEAPQVPQPLAPSSRLPLLRDYLSRRAEVWWSRPRTPTYRHPRAPPPPPPASCCFHIALLAPCYFACWT